MRKIPLTQEQVSLVDNEDFDELIKSKWFAVWDKATQSFYAMRSGKDSNGVKRERAMHRAIINPSKGKQIDHKNHDTLNNQRSNLREASGTQNQGNQRLKTCNTSGFKGVSFYKDQNKWGARIQYLGKKKHLGIFNHKIDAAKAYNKEAKILFGDFAFLNPIPV